MPQTSTAINACNAVIRLADKNGVLVDISGSANEATIDLDNKLGDYKSFGSRWYGRLECGSDASIKLKILYTTAALEAMEILIDWYFNTRGNKRIQVCLPDESAGSDRYECLVKLASASGIGGAADKAEPIMVSLDLKPHNGISHNTIGS